MAIDYERTRADTSGLARASDSTDTNQTQTQLTQSVMRNFQESIGGGIARAGRAIGAGIEKRFDTQKADKRYKEQKDLEESRYQEGRADTELHRMQDRGDVESRFSRNLASEEDDRRLRRETNAPVIAARNRDLATEQKFHDLMGTSEVKRGEDIVSPGKRQDRKVLASQLLRDVYGDSLGSFDDLDESMQRPFMQIVDSTLDQQLRVHQGGPDVAKEFGPKEAQQLGYGSAAEAGTSMLEQARDQARALATTRGISQRLIEQEENQDQIRQYTKDKNPELAHTHQVFRNNPKLKAGSDAIDPYWDANFPQTFMRADGTTVQGSAKKLVMTDGMTAADIARNRNQIRTEIPKIAIGANGKISTVFSGDHLSKMDGATKKVASRFVDKSIDDAHAGLTGWAATEDIVAKLKKGDFGAGSSNKNLASVKATLAKAMKDVDEDEVRGIIANQMGWLSTPDNYFASNAALGGESSAKFMNTLQGLTKLSPELAGLITKPTDPAGSNEATDIYDQKFKEGLDHGNFVVRAGPLAFLNDTHLSDGEAAVILNEFRNSALATPEYQGLQGLLLQGGLDNKEASKAARSIHPQLVEQLGALRTGFIDDRGIPFDKLKPADQKAIQLDQAQQLVEQELRGRGVRKGASSKASLAGVAGAPSFVTRFDAAKLAQDAVKGEPMYGEGVAEISIPGSDDRISLKDGKPQHYLRKNKTDSGYTHERFADQNYNAAALDEAFKVSQVVYDSYNATGSERAKRALSVASSGVGDSVVDGVLQMEVGPSDQKSSIYKWLDMQLSDPSGKTQDPAIALLSGLAKYGSENGVDLFEIRDRFVAAANKTEDPVIDAVAVFLGEHASPNKTKYSDVKPGGAIAGTDPNLKALGNTGYAESRAAEAKPGASPMDDIKGARAAAAAEPPPEEVVGHQGAEPRSFIYGSTDPLGDLMGYRGNPLARAGEMFSTVANNAASGAASLLTQGEALWQNMTDISPKEAERQLGYTQDPEKRARLKRQMAGKEKPAPGYVKQLFQKMGAVK